MLARTTILTQMVAGFSAILILVISAISYFSYRMSSQIVLDKTNTYLLESVIQMSGKIDGMLGEYDRLSLRIIFSEAAQNYLKKSNMKLPGEVSVIDLQKVITHEQSYLRNDLMVDFMDKNGGFAFTMRGKNEVFDRHFLSTIRSHEGKMLWTINDKFILAGQHSERNMSLGVLGTRLIKNYDTSANIGYMLMVIPLEATERVIGSFFVDSSKKVQVIDQFGNIVYSTFPNEIKSRLPSDLASEFDRRHNSLHRVLKKEIDGKSTYISSYTSGYSGWTIIAYTELAEAVNELHAVQRGILVIGAIGLTAAVLLTSFFSWSLSFPIRYLAARLVSIKRGRLTRFKGKLINHEVQVLYDSFNEMIGDLDHTIQDLTYRKVREKQARLIALKAQFRPHFLYNTLNVIYFYAVKNKQPGIAGMILSLSELLRYSVLPGSEFVTIREDLGQLKRFLELQYARFEDKLKVEISADEALMECRVMKLLLQPLIENAITHGLEPLNSRPWFIRVSIAREGDAVRFVIEDSGIGMSPEDREKALFIDELDTPDYESFHSGLGLANLHHRIRLIYGPDFGLALSESDLGGLKVQFTLPPIRYFTVKERHHEHFAG